MSVELAGQRRKAIYKFVLCQTIIAGVTALAFFLVKDSLAAKSAFKGGLVAIIPGLVFAFFAFRFSGAQEAYRVKASLMRGHSLKLLLTVVLLAVVFKQEDLAAEAFLTGFLVTLLAQWTAPFFFKH